MYIRLVLSVLSARTLPSWAAFMPFAARLRNEVKASTRLGVYDIPGIGYQLLEAGGTLVIGALKQI